jgi:hypothetical protein
MGNLLFDTDIAGIIADVIGPAVLDVTIRRDVRGARDPDNLTGGRASVPVEFQCKGFWDDINSGSVPAGIETQLTDRVLVLIGDTVQPDGLPLRNDRCTVHEAAGDLALNCLRPLRRDPAAAVYTFLCGDRRGPDGQ